MNLQLWLDLDILTLFWRIIGNFIFFRYVTEIFLTVCHGSRDPHPTPLPLDTYWMVPCIQVEQIDEAYIHTLG